MDKSINDIVKTWRTTSLPAPEAMGQIARIVEAHPIECERQPAPRGNECDVCGGDCSSANPPVYNCPSKINIVAQPVAVSAEAEKLATKIAEIAWIEGDIDADGFAHMIEDIIQSALSAAKVEGARLGLEQSKKIATDFHDKYAGKNGADYLAASGNQIAHEIAALSAEDIAKGGAA